MALVFLVYFGLTGAVPAADYYVDNAGTGAGDGRSWATAWARFADIDWHRLGAGDTLNISGGSEPAGEASGAAGKVYTETLVVGASGKAGRPLRIRAADVPGHAGGVIIDAENSRAFGVLIDDHDHVRVQGLAVRNVAEAGVGIRRSRAGVIVEGMAVAAGNPTAQGNTRGYDVRDSVGVVIQDSAYSTPEHSTAQTDGIFSTNNDAVRFARNRLIISNNYEGPNDGHNDCIQSYQDENIEVVGNYCEQRNTKRGNSLGIFVQNISGTALVVNNVVVSPNTHSACLAVENLSGFGTEGRMLAYHNSAYGCAYGTLHIVRSPNSEARNNILVSPAPDAQAMKVVAPVPRPSLIDHNLLFAPASSKPVFFGSSGLKTWAQWRVIGYDAAGLYGDPGFRDPARGDLTLAPASPAIGRGEPLPLVEADQTGRERSPIAPALGAFEGAGGGDPVGPGTRRPTN